MCVRSAELCLQLVEPVHEPSKTARVLAVETQSDPREIDNVAVGDLALRSRRAFDRSLKDVRELFRQHLQGFVVEFDVQAEDELLPD